MLGVQLRAAMFSYQMGFICQTWGLKQRAHADSTLFFAMKWDLCGKSNTKNQ